MCYVSVILDYGRNRIPINQWDRQSFDQFQRVVKEAEVLDATTGQPDCEDPEKAQWMREVEERLRALEDGSV